MYHHRFNREILASITFEPPPKKIRGSSATPTSSAPMASAALQQAQHPHAPTTTATATIASSESQGSQETASATSGADAETQLIIACMKLALSKSISNISLPDKNRPLDPRKDFSIASSIQFKPPKSERQQGSNSPPPLHLTCCSSVVKENRQPPLGSGNLTASHPEAPPHGSAAWRRHGLRAVDPQPVPSTSSVHTPPPTSIVPPPSSAAIPAAAAAHDEDDDDEEEEEEENVVHPCGMLHSGHPCKAQASFVFTDYSPMCYRHIRGFFQIDPHSYRQVLVQSTWHSVPTPGKSSAQLFFCGQNWVIKTMTKQESDFLRNVLHKYYYHARDNPYTLLPHFVGHHMIELNGKQITFVIMQNVFATANKINEKYDLKGSTVGRFATKVEKMKQTCTQKDLDINRPILIGEQRRELLVDQMKKDCDFLKRSSIMDYSLLVGIHGMPPGGGEGGGDGVAIAKDDAVMKSFEEDNERVAAGGGVCSASSFVDGRCFTADQGGMLSSDDVNGRREIYYVGIIDILQEYTLWKRSETLVQGIRRMDMHQISSVHPNEYATRFLSFMSSLLV